MARRGTGFRMGRNRVSQPSDQARSPVADSHLTLQGLLMSGATWLAYTIGSAIGRELAGKLEAVMAGQGDGFVQRKSATAVESKQ